MIISIYRRQQDSLGDGVFLLYSNDPVFPSRKEKESSVLVKKKNKSIFLQKILPPKYSVSNMKGNVNTSLI